MTKLNKLFGALVSLMLIISLTGCKKSSEYPSFIFTGPTAIYFEYDQTFSTEFTKKYIDKIEIGEVPAGWSCINTGSAMKLTAPSASNLSADASGTITITATTNRSTTITRTLSVEVKYAEDLTPTQSSPTANCYMVNQPGTRYKFNGQRKGHESTETLNPSGAKLVWSSVKGGVSHVVFIDGELYFATEDTEDGSLTECNAVVAALNSDSEIIWSWHIWVTEYDPETENDLLESMTVMNRNLGAFGNSNADSGTVTDPELLYTDETYQENIAASYGLYYQWGRKDPFVGPASFRSTTGHSMYNGNKSWFKVTIVESSADTGTIAYATANPTTIITGVEASSYDWLYAARKNDLWGNANNTTRGTVQSTGSKSVYDPCPAGWMVAPPKIWMNFTTTQQASSNVSDFNVNTTDGFRDGWTFSVGGVDMFYPAGGRYSYIRGRLSLIDSDSVESTGYYWSNSNYSSTLGAVLTFNKGYVNPATHDNTTGENVIAEISRAGACPVRCVKI